MATRSSSKSAATTKAAAGGKQAAAAKTHGKSHRATLKDTVNVAIIGCGNLGRIHAGCLAAIPQARVLGFADVVEDLAERALAQFGGEYATTDPQRVFDDKRVDAVYIATRHDSHAPLSVAAARAGKHVMIEKPIAVTLDECRQIERAVAESGIFYMPAFKMRYYPLIRQAHEFIPKPHVQLGQIIKKPWANERWDMRPEQGGGPILNQGCHGIDLIRFLAGAEVAQVYATGGTHTHPGHPVPDQLMAAVRFEDGRGASWIQGDAGAAKMTGDFFWEIFADGKSVQLWDRLMRATFNDGEKSWTEERPEEEAFQLESVEFITALREGRQPGITAWDGIQATRVPLAAIESIRTGQVQDVSREAWQRGATSGNGSAKGAAR